MSRDFEQRLDDIIDSCDRVADYISGYDLAKFEDDYKTSAGACHAAGTGYSLAAVCGVQGCFGTLLFRCGCLCGLGGSERVCAEAS